LSGCRFVPWRQRVLVLREAAAASASVSLEPGASLVWDRRFAVAMPAEASQRFTLGYLGAVRPPVPLNGDLPRLVHSVLPALWDDQGLAAVPLLGFRRADVGTLPTISFRSATPLSPPRFTVV